MNGKPQPLEHDQIKEIKNELLDMRENINNLLSRLDTFSDERSFHDQFNAPSQNTGSSKNTSKLKTFILYFHYFQIHEQFGRCIPGCLPHLLKTWKLTE